MYKKGDKLVCLNTINNFIAEPLFIEGEIYTVLDVDGEDVTLDHILYANEYADFTIDYIDKNFATLKEIRKEKLNKIDESDL